MIFGVISLSGSIQALGISAGFLGMIVGWSLQQPVTGIAAWLMLILKRPFRIGQRVIIAGIKGDVVDITLTHVILDQVGGTIVGEERSGRSILIPNAILFTQTITNYTFEVEYILSEVPVRITFQSDWEEAEKILVGAAERVTANTIEITGEEPYIRAELFDAGVLMRLRYRTTPEDYAKDVNDIVKIIYKEFSENDNVEFCYPHSEVLYSMKNPPPVAISGRTTHRFFYTPTKRRDSMNLNLPKVAVPDRISLVQPITANERTTIANLEGPGCIRHIWATAGREGNGRQVIIRIYFDEEPVPHIEAPFGDFFGVMHGLPWYPVNNRYLSVQGFSGYNCYFDMPFARSARIEVECGMGDSSIIMFVNWHRFPDQELEEPRRFCARWRREAPTERYGEDFLLLDADGRGATGRVRLRRAALR